MTTITHTIRKFTASFVAAAIVTTSATADVTNVKEALGLALKQEAIAAAGYKMKLYSLSANYNGDNKRWSFQFYDGGTSLHSCSIDKSGKVRYYVRDKGSMRIFDDVDFTKLPAPNEVLIEDLVGQGKPLSQHLSSRLLITVSSTLITTSVVSSARKTKPTTPGVSPSPLVMVKKEKPLPLKTVQLIPSTTLPSTEVRNNSGHIEYKFV